MRCVICGSQMNEVGEVVCAEENIRLFDNPHTIRYGKVKLYRCLICTHMQIENKTSNDIYEDDYNVDYSCWDDTIEKDRIYLRKLTTLFENNCICEIGCGEGRTLKLATEYYQEVIGVEPAKRQALIAEKSIQDKGTVKNEFFSKDTHISKELDAFYSKMVFEHLEDPCSVLARVFEVLKPGGVGWINIPNGQRIYDQSLYHLFSYVHLQYYTPFSISVMMNKIGFEIIQIDSHEDNSEIIDIDIIVRKPQSERGCFEQKRTMLKREIKNKIKECDTVTIWGAGTKAHKYIDLISSDINIKHIVDKNDEKIGKYISRLPIAIEKVTEDILQQSDVVLIFASMYNYEIISELKSRKYRGKVIYFEKGTVQQLNLIEEC